MGQETPIKTEIGRYHKRHPWFNFYIINLTIYFVRKKNVSDIFYFIIIFFL